MRDFTGFTGIFYAAAEWVMRFSVVNILWFLLNLPALFIVSSIYLNGFEAGFVWYLMPILIFIPVLSVPSTAAVFSMVRDWIMQTDQKSLTKSFFFYLKKDYRKNLLAGLVLQIFWLVWLIDFYFFKAQSSGVEILFIIIGAGLFIYTINFFSLSVHYRMGIRDLMKNAFFITVGNPLMSIFIFICNLSLVYTGMTELLFLFPFFICSLSAFLSFLAFYRFSLKVKTKAQLDKTGDFVQ